MRDQQYLRFKELGEQLIDIVLVELDPTNWSGHGQTLAELTKSDRGDRYWSKKNAGQTLTLIIKMQSLSGMVERAQRGSGEQPPVGDGVPVPNELDEQIKQATKQATAILERAHAARVDGRKH